MAAPAAVSPSDTAPASFLAWRWYRDGLALVLLLAWLLRIYKLSRQSLSADEIATLMASQVSSLDQFLQMHAGLDHPPLYFMFLKLWAPLAGTSEFALRAPSALAAVVMVGLLVDTGQRMGGARLGLLAGLLAAVSPFEVFFGQEARGYSLMLALVAGAFTVTLRIERTPAARRLWLLWGALVTAAFFTEYVAAPVLALQSLFLLWVAWRAGRVPLWLLAHLPGAACLAAWVAYVDPLRSVYGTVSDLTPHDGMLDIVQQTLAALTAGEHPGAIWPLAAVITVAATAGGLALAPLPLRYRWWLAGCLLGPAGAVFAVAAAGRLGFNPRYLLPSSLAFLLLAGGLLAAVWQWRRPAGIAALAVAALPMLVALQAYYTEPFAGRPDFRGASEFLRDRYRTGDVVVFDAPWAKEPMEWYSGGSYTSVGQPSTVPLDAARMEADLRGLTGRYPRLWLGRWQDWFTDSQQQVRQWLNRNAAKVEEQGFAYVTVEGYLSADPVQRSAPQVAHPLDVSLDGQVSLVGYDVADVAGLDGRFLRVTLTWRSQGPTRSSYKGFVHLVDGQGRLVDQDDHRPVNDRIPTDRWERGWWVRDAYEVDLPPPGQAGSYRLYAGMYDEAGVRLLVNGADHVDLGPVQTGG